MNDIQLYEKQLRILSDYESVRKKERRRPFITAGVFIIGFLGGVLL